MAALQSTVGKAQPGILGPMHAHAAALLMSCDAMVTRHEPAALLMSCVALVTRHEPVQHMHVTEALVAWRRVRQDAQDTAAASQGHHDPGRAARHVHERRHGRAGGSRSAGRRPQLVGGLPLAQTFHQQATPSSLITPLIAVWQLQRLWLRRLWIWLSLPSSKFCKPWPHASISSGRM